MGGLGGCWPCRSCDGWGVRALRGWKLSDGIRFVTAAPAEECLSARWIHAVGRGGSSAWIVKIIMPRHRLPIPRSFDLFHIFPFSRSR